MDKKAGIMVESFGQAQQEAAAVELAYVTEELRKNTAAMYMISSLLKNDNLVALLDGRLQGGPKAPPAKVTNIRVAYKKFKHLTKTKGLIEKILARIDPGTFAPDVFRTWTDMDEKLGVMCMALGVSRNTALPNQYYEGLSSQEAFLSACSQRYAGIGRIMAGRSLDEIKRGWYDVDNAHTVTCFLSRGEGRARQVFDDNASIAILQPFETTTSAEVSQYGRTYLCNDLKSVFEDAGVVFPDEDAEWRLPDAQRKRSRTPRVSRRRYGSFNPSESQAASARATRPLTSGLSAVLAKRLQTQAGKGAK
ncbi:MAG: hypothetical protein GY772_29670 [bacterium]|nr:hypothetical protein [bacterium]